MQHKIITYSKIDTIQKAENDKRIVLVGGCFDILHFGHLTFLQGAKQEGDVLVVALESDKFIEHQKQRKPVHTQEQRATVLSALNFVDYVLPLPFIEDSEAYVHLVQSVKPTVIAVTEGDTKIHLKRGHAAQVGGAVKVVCPQLTSFSTSKIIQYASLFSD